MKRSDGVERLVLVVGIAIFVDTLFLAVITPLLPQLSHELHLSKLSAGVLTASYAAGMLVASLPAGALAVRRGPRFTVIIGLLLLSISTVGFALLDTAPGLDIARFVEGVGGACSWAGGIAWIVAATPPDRRGAVMGRALGMAIGGSLFGPAVGALASVVGRPVLFCVLAAVPLALLVPIRKLPDRRGTSDQPVADVIRILHRPALAGALWLMALPAVLAGVFNVLGPLRLHDLGAGAGVIGAVFLAGAVLETAVAPASGRFSDRHGRMLPLRGALVALAVGMACFTLPSSALALGILMTATMAALGVFWAPVMALLSDVAEANGVDQAHAAALMNLGWAAGQIVGSVGAGAAGKAFGDLVPTLAASALCLLTLLVLGGPGRAARPAATG